MNGTEVVVVGGGIAGTTIAWELARRGRARDAVRAGLARRGRVRAQHRHAAAPDRAGGRGDAARVGGDAIGSSTSTSAGRRARSCCWRARRSSCGSRRRRERRSRAGRRVVRGRRRRRCAPRSRRSARTCSAATSSTGASTVDAGAGHARVRGGRARGGRADQDATCVWRAVSAGGRADRRGPRAPPTRSCVATGPWLADLVPSRRCKAGRGWLMRTERLDVPWIVEEVSWPDQAVLGQRGGAGAAVRAPPEIVPVGECVLLCPLPGGDALVGASLSTSLARRGRGHGRAAADGASGSSRSPRGCARAIVRAWWGLRPMTPDGLPLAGSPDGV